MPVTLAQIVTEAKELADESGSTFVEDTQWNIWANRGARKLARIVARINASLCITKTTGTILSAAAVPGSNLIAIPAGALGVYMVERDPTSSTLRRFLKPINPISKNVRTGTLGYWRDASNVYVEPAEQSAGAYALYYYAGSTTMTAGVNLDTHLEPWWEYVATFAASRALAKDKLDNAELERQLVDMEENDIAPQAAMAGGILQTGIVDTSDGVFAADERWE